MLPRWNKAATSAGFAGSEYVNEPEYTFDRVGTRLHTMMKTIKRLTEDVSDERRTNRALVRYSIVATALFAVAFWTAVIVWWSK